MSAGDTFLLVSKIGGVEHLWIILLDPDPSGDTIIVNATTKKEYHNDLTVILRAGEHPFITQDSIILYAQSKLSNVKMIDKGINTGLVKPYPAPCSPEMFARIKQGLLESPYTPRKLKSFYQAQV